MHIAKSVNSVESDESAHEWSRSENDPEGLTFYQNQYDLNLNTYAYVYIYICMYIYEYLRCEFPQPE